jgi:hypothetical protein
VSGTLIIGLLGGELSKFISFPFVPEVIFVADVLICKNVKIIRIERKIPKIFFCILLPPDSIVIVYDNLKLIKKNKKKNEGCFFISIAVMLLLILEINGKIWQRNY